MAYFNLKNTGASLVFASTTITCMQTVDITGNAPVTEVECSGSSSVTYVTGVPRYTMTVTGALDDEDDSPLLAGLALNTNGTVAFDPAGTATDTIDISSMSATVSDYSIGFPVSGFSTYSFTLVLDDITIGANV